MTVNHGVFWLFLPLPIPDSAAAADSDTVHLAVLDYSVKWIKYK